MIIRCIAPHVPALVTQVVDILAFSIGASAMAWGPPTGIDIVPRGVAFRHADSKDLCSASKGRAHRVPDVGQGGPRSGVLILEISSGPEETTNDIGVSTPEGNVERASKSVSVVTELAL